MLPQLPAGRRGRKRKKKRRRGRILYPGDDAFPLWLHPACSILTYNDYDKGCNIYTTSLGFIFLFENMKNIQWFGVFHQ